MDSRSKGRRARPPLNPSTLDELALRYVGKYATTRSKLRAYLARKIKERGWEAERSPDLEALGERLASLGYIDDAAFAMSKSRSLSSRGYGKRRLSVTLRLAGVGEPDSAAASAHAEAEAVNAALRFAQRRRLGPFANSPADRPLREKWIAAMIRAGHDFALARAIASLEPGSDIDLGQLWDTTRFIDA